MRTSRPSPRHGVLTNGDLINGDLINGVLTPMGGLGWNKLKPQNPSVMQSTPVLHSSRLRSSGFTLIELLIAIAIVGILAAVAYPSFLDALRKNRRSDAMSAVASIQQAQERWRTNRPAFADNSLLTTAAPNGLAQSAASSSGYYALSIVDADAVGYTIIATAVAGTSQDSDSSCKIMGVQANGGTVRYGGGATGADWTDPNRCWAR
jgi:type IV pilus assembly protein PilE